MDFDRLSYQRNCLYDERQPFDEQANEKRSTVDSVTSTTTGLDRTYPKTESNRPRCVNPTNSPPTRRRERIPGAAIHGESLIVDGFDPTHESSD
jgi:hypothetical protein